MNAVLGSIIENLKHVRIAEDPTVEVFRSDTDQTGDAREYTVKELIEAYFPQDYFVRKGRIFSLKSRSQSIDCVVLFPNHPRLITPVRQVIIAEGVFAAVEVKPDIRTLTSGSEFHRGLMQIQSVKKLNRELNVNVRGQKAQKLEWDEYLNTIPAVIFSFQSSSAQATMDYMAGRVKDDTVSDKELPDMVVTLDHGIIFYTPCFSKSPLAVFKKDYTDKFPENASAEKVFIHLDLKDKESTLAFFFLIMLKFTPPDSTSHLQTLLPYLIDGLKHVNCNFLPLQTKDISKQ